MIKMEETEQAVKRQRLSTHSTQIRVMHPHQPEGSVSLPLHNQPQGASALNPPIAYRETLPNSPFTHNNEGRQIPEQPPQGGYSHAPVNTQLANQDRRPMSDQPPSAYSRNGSISTPIRSPDEGHALRPLTTSFSENGPPHYQQHPNSEVGEQPPPGYHPHDGGPPPPHGSFHGMPMSQPHDPAHGPPPQSAMPTYAEPEMVHGHQTPGGYPQPQPYHTVPTPTQSRWPAFPGTASTTRKATRAQQACDNCRTRKAKCDEGKPACSYCRETNQPCVYKEVQPPKADRAHKDIMDQLRQNQDDINGLRKDLSNSLTEIHRLISMVAPAGARSRPTSSRNNELDHAPARDEYMDNSRGPTTPKANNTGLIQDDANMYDYPADQSMGDLDKSIAVDHSTGVHRLLRWPNIQALLDSASVKNSVKRTLTEDYVLQFETAKGVLRIYGRGQGPDKYDGGSPIPASPATSTASTTRSDESSKSPAPSPPDVWGANIGPPNMTTDGKFSNNSTDDHPGGLNPDGTLKIDKLTMDTLLKSYLDSIHILHPFLDKARLKRMFDKFYAQCHPHEQQNQLRSPYAFPNSITHPDPIVRPSRKRKHSSGDSPRESSYSDPGRLTSDHLVERRISTAIVLLVMALGKICTHKDFLPGPVPDLAKDMHHTQPTSSPYGTESPSLKTSPSRVGSPTSAYLSENRMSFNPRSSDHGSPDTPLKDANRNVDVIPGLAYYAKATEILGALQGGIDLPNVQAQLLASLYMGQLACSIESWSWIGQACRNCVFLMLRKNFNEMKDEVRKQLIYFAYWTCFQFEGDILAELDLKSSGLEEYTLTPFPRSVQSVEATLTGSETVNPNEDRVIYYYSAQIIMRTTLNKIQTVLYPPDSRQRPLVDLIHNRDECLTSLAHWRRLLPPALRWNDEDGPADNILDARLRAKYWGTLYIITRPLLNHVIHIEQNATKETAAQILRDPEVLRSCRQCVFAAKQSTVAFDNLVFENGRAKNRLIVTNIFGTAHAQFGNVLVLSAVYKSPLQHLIAKDDLIKLLNRTISFLGKLAPISDTLRTDANILRGILGAIDPASHYNPSSSFSSNM